MHFFEFFSFRETQSDCWFQKEIETKNRLNNAIKQTRKNERILQFSRSEKRVGILASIVKQKRVANELGKNNNF